MRTISNPPDASALMTSARSFGNYDLAAALADLIDNSIKAKATTVDIRCIFNAGEPEVSVVDNGHGMDEAELFAAMRPASSNPSAERAPDDLGRFGWGMKSASFSQCRMLTVFSRKNGIASGAVWDLDSVNDWSMTVLSDQETHSRVSETFPKTSGTEIRWSKCDRLSENSSLDQPTFNDLIDRTASQLALVFHRFLSGDAGTKRLTLTINGTVLQPFDPFYRNHDATQQLEEEVLPVGGTFVRIRPYVLPHFSKLSTADHERLGGEGGFVRNQGFYVYRNHRLIIHGTWFRLAKFGELSQLVRISIDIPNSLDDAWKITVDKRDAQLPAALRNRLGQIVAGLKGRSARVYRGKGGRLDVMGTTPVWSRHARNGEVRYSINREHPAVDRLLQEDGEGVASAVLRLIEQGFPVTSFSSDAANRPSDIAQTVCQPEEIFDLLELLAPGVLAELGGDMKAMIQRLRGMEPFAAHWTIVEDRLRAKGWV